jgi:PAS domain S-box-containing protein
MLFDEAPIGYHEIDVEGRLTRVNRTELAMLGYDEGEMLGRHVWEFILDCESSHGSVLAKLNGEMKAGSNYERTFVRKDGAKIDVMVEDFFLYGGGGNITGIRSVLQDITERKMTEDALRHALKMESLGLLAGGVAHDFNNILYVILGNTSLAMKRLTTSHAAYANVQKAQSAAHQGVHIIKQLLACSGNGKVSMKPMSMNNLLRENGSLLDIVVQKNVRMVMDLLPSIPPIVGDEGQLQQVVMNLIINAAEAIGTKPGTILCRTWMEDVESANEMEWVALDQSSVPGRFVMLEIRDDGIGMSRETLRRVFDPYFTTKRTGRGLGLSAFIGIIKTHHGGFRVQTEPNKGTAFQVALPAFSSQVAATPVCPMHGSKKKMGGCHVITIR